MAENPFTERGRITEPRRFAGRWSELSLIFDAIQAGRPVLVSGGPGIGKSSLLGHIADAAAANLEREDLRAYYLDLADATAAPQVYRTVVEALGQRGETAAALEVALLADDAPTLLCLDNAHAAIAAGWGAGMLEALARTVRSGALILVAALDGAPPLLSERFAHVRLGAFAPAEVRLLADAYLDGTGVQFTPQDLRELARLSVAHPAYVQRAASHLFRSKLEPGYDWRAAYLAEARERPVPGAPLPPAVFEGDGAGSLDPSRYGGDERGVARHGPQLAQLPDLPPALAFALPLLAAALLFVVSGNIPLALVVGLGGIVAVAAWLRRGT
ncbi:MAG TPA: AAA family ATPase [Roseiflexaceae bacterium]|nr:AAA family ATPase [Roseiflexaceae bacterium]